MPTSTRTFDGDRNMTVRSEGTPIYSDFQLPEIGDLRKIRARGPRRQAEELGRGQASPLSGAGHVQNYGEDREALYGQVGAGYMQGGVFGWQPGMAFGTGTTPTAIGSRRVRPGSGGSGGGGGGGSVGSMTSNLDAIRALTDQRDAERDADAADYRAMQSRNR